MYSSNVTAYIAMTHNDTLRLVFMLIFRGPFHHFSDFEMGD